MREYFPRILGNEGAKNRICTAILSGRVPHAFLIDGAEGSGKHTLALHIAMALNCEKKSSPNSSLPCYECNNCRRIMNGGFVDVKTLERNSDRATIGVGEIKDFRADMFLSATESEYKIYIIRDAEKMTPEAQNALLIVLEEPPKNVIIMLLASGTDKILTTIKSRAQYVATSRFTPSEIGAYLKATSPGARALDDEKFRAAILGADGRIGRALELIDPTRADEENEKRSQILDFVKVCAPGTPFRALSGVIDGLTDKRTELLPVLEGIISALCDMITVKRSRGCATQFFPDADEAVRAGAGMDIRRLLKIYDTVNAAHLDCSRNANVSALLTGMAVKIHLLRV